MISDNGFLEANIQQDTPQVGDIMRLIKVDAGNLNNT